MFHKVFLLLISIMTIFNTSICNANIIINDIQYEKIGEQIGQIKVFYKGTISQSIKYSTRDDLAQIEIQDATVWPKIEKKVEYWDDQKQSDAQLLAYQYDKNTVRVRMVFDKKMDWNANDNSLLNLSTTENYITFNFPLKTNSFSDERFILDEIEKTEESKKTILSTPVASAVDPNLNIKKDIKGPNLYEYMVKISVFTILVLGIFYGIVQIFKKSVIRKGKLAFLKNENIVTVIGQNYLSPKRSLITVKVMDQVFLLANSENGISFLSELTSVAKVLKESEKQITGNNFDDSLDVNMEKDVSALKVREKKDILNSVSDKITISEKLKEKMKKLKPLQ